jgi:outer membrane protein assembly factor BamB
VACYRLADGALLWLHRSHARHEHRVGGIGPRSTPTIAGGRVYTQGATGIVLCLDLASGAEVWRQELLQLAGWSQRRSEDEITWGRAGSPLLVGELCVVPFGGPDDDETGKDSAGGAEQRRGRGLIAFDQADGTIRWTAGDDQISFASPMLMNLAGTEQIVIVNERSVTGHAIEDGRQLWRSSWRGRSNGAANCAAALPVDATAFLVGKAYGTGSGVFEVLVEGDGFSVQERWARPNVLKTKFTHACIAGGFAYGLSDGLLECVDVASGKRTWAQPRGDRYGHGQVILVEDVLVVQTEAGEVAFVAARSDGFEELAKLPALGGKSWNVPSVAGRYLAIRNDSQAIVYHLPPRSDVPLPSDSTESADIASHSVQAPIASSQPRSVSNF